MDISVPNDSNDPNVADKAAASNSIDNNKETPNQVHHNILEDSISVEEKNEIEKLLIYENVITEVDYRTESLC